MCSCIEVAFLSDYTWASNGLLSYPHRIEGTYSLGADDGDSLDQVWIRCGVLAGSTLTLLCLLTLRPIRALNYEAFLWIHFIFSL